jgi:type I restriction enzyme M protein
MFIRLRLKNWRSIDDAEVEFAPFTVVVGRNSSGKSNLVDALRFASEIGRDAATAVSRRGGIASIRRWGPSKPFDITIEVRTANTRAALDSGFAQHECVLKSGREGAWFFEREKVVVADGDTQFAVARKREELEVVVKGGKQGGKVVAPQLPDTTSAMLWAGQFMPGRTHRTERTILPVRAIRPVPELMRQPHQPGESATLAETAANITTALGKMTEIERGAVTTAMRRIVPGLVDVRAELAGRYATLVFTQGQGDDRRPDFAATEMSDGALRALAVVVAAQQMARGELLIVEEPEVSLHPGAADVVYDELHRASSRGAVLVTTHSPELLDRAKDDEILVCEYVDGVTRIGPLADEQRTIVRKGLFSAAELMRTEDLRREGAEPRVVRDSD